MFSTHSCLDRRDLHLPCGHYLLAGTTSPQQSDKPDWGGAGTVRIRRSEGDICSRCLLHHAAEFAQCLKDYARIEPAPESQEDPQV